MKRDPCWDPRPGDVFSTTSPHGRVFYREVVEVLLAGRFPNVTYRRGDAPGAGPKKTVPWSSWRAYARMARHLYNTTTKEEEKTVTTPTRPRLIRLQLADSGPDGDAIIWINPDTVLSVYEVKNPHSAGYRSDRCRVDTSAQHRNLYITHTVLGSVDYIAGCINRGEDDLRTPLCDPTALEEEAGRTCWGDRVNPDPTKSPLAHLDKRTVWAAHPNPGG